MGANNSTFKIGDYVKYNNLMKDKDDSIFQIYNLTGGNTGYMRNVKTQKPIWEQFKYLQYAKDYEINAIKYNL